MSVFHKLLKWAAAAAVVIGLAGLVAALNFSAVQKERTAAALQNLSYYSDFTLHGLDGETFTQADLKGHKVTVINGWAPWCGPCVNELPDLQKLNEEYRDQGLQVVGVVADYHTKTNDQSYPDEIRKVVDSTGVTYPILVSDDAFSDGPFPTMNSAFPGTWAVDENGKLIEFVSGARSEENWRELFDKWLSESGEGQS